MNHLASAVALVVSLSLATTPATAAIKVFLLAGQSNMVGSGSTSQLSPPYNAEQAKVKIWQYDTKSWVNLKPGGYVDDSTNSGKFGPELTFGYTISNLLPDDEIYLVKCAKSATSLYTNWKPGNSLYNTFKSRVNNALADLKASGKTYSVEGMLWMQGEGDGGVDYAANAYDTNLTNFISTVRSDFSSPDMRFVIGRIIDVWHEHCDIVQDAQESVASKVYNVGIVNTDDLPLVKPTDPNHNYHYNTAGQIELGIRFAQTMVVPEPSVLLLIITGLLALLGFAIKPRRTSGE